MGIPVIIGNIATSLDGKIAPFDRSRTKISVDEDFLLRDLIRSESDGILIGGRTLLYDQPSLTIKNSDLISKRVNEGKEPQPAGICLCGNQLPLSDNHFFEVKGNRKIIICPDEAAVNYPGCEIIHSGKGRPDIRTAMEKLYDCGIKKLMVEGGGTIMFEFLRLKLMREFYISIHPIIIGGSGAPTCFDGDGFNAEEIVGLNVIKTRILSDGGIIYHCTTDNYKPQFNY